MRKHLTKILLSGGAAALAIGIGATTAMAVTATTWTVTPGGSVTGTAGKTTLTDTVTKSVLTCTSSATAATLKSGSGQKNPIGEITSVTFSNCTGPGGIAFTATTSASSSNPFPLKASKYASGVTHGTVGNITATLTSKVGCNATVAGTTASTPGQTKGTYNNKTGVLKVSGGNLHVWNVSSGCLGLINTGDASTFVGSYTISPKQTITSP